jgi:hypothetical protein
MQVYAKRYTVLQLKIRKNKCYHEKRTAHWYIFTSVLLKPLKQHLIGVSSFRPSKSLYSRSVLFKRTYNSGSVFAYRFDRRIYEIKFPTHVSFVFSILYLSYCFNFAFDAQNLPFIRDCSHLIT